MGSDNNEVAERDEARCARCAEVSQLSLDGMLEGYVLFEVARNKRSRPLGYYCQEFNRAAERIVGVRRDEVVGKELCEVFAGVDVSQVLAGFSEVMSSGEPAVMLGVKFPQESDDKLVDISCFRIGAGHVVCMLRDNTEQNYLDRNRQHWLGVLEAKAKQMQGIIYAASHDLRTPLINIEGFTGEVQRSVKELGVLLKAVEMDAEVRQRIDYILGEDIPAGLGFVQAGAEKMQSLISGLLRLSRIGSAKVCLDAVDMNELVDAIRRTVEYQLQHEGVEFSVGDLPGCVGDEVQLNQVFSNLIDNSIKYLRPGCAGRISVIGDVEGDRCVYSVRDNGVGMRQKDLGRIFDLFHRVDPECRVAGEGLGLTLVSSILERLGGEIGVESEVGVGTVFKVWLPRV